LQNAGTDADFVVLKSRGSDGGQLWRRELDGALPGMGESYDSAWAVAVDATGTVFAAGTLNGLYTAIQFNGLDGSSSPQATSVTLTTSPNPAALGDEIELQANVTSVAGAPDGVVEFFDGASSLGTAVMWSGVAYHYATGLIAGTHSLTARYEGNEFFGAHTSAVVPQVVNPPNVVVTQTGTGVVSEPIATLPDGTEAPVTVRFDNVAAAGSTTVTTSIAGPPPPDGFKLQGGQQPIYYDVNTTASFTGTATICLTWQEGQIANENNARLFHYTNGRWADITTSLDTQNNVICGQTTSFSPFVIAEPRIFGFYQPVDNLPTINRTKGGNAVPVKFSLGAAEGLDIFATNYPVSVKINCTGTVVLDDVEQTVTAGASSFSYDATTGVYTYVWKTDKTWAGTCRQLQLRLKDGAMKYANFQLMK
jgi:hypothetical protein